MPRLGLGTWHMGESRADRGAEVSALRAGIELGMALIDTAEMYGDGGAEEVVGEALRGGRDGVFMVSKFYPHHASRAKLRAACAASLARLGLDRIDCYLYHWRGSVPLAETVGTLEDLVREGKIASWGVSNFDVSDLEELVAIPGGERVAANQVLYNLNARGIEFDLIAWCAGRAIDVMAYSPLDEGRLVGHSALAGIARGLGITPAQLALAWVLRDPRVVAIPKAAKDAHLRANRAAADLGIDAATLAELDRVFPPPRRKTALAMI
jgi:diketogulonate reductase-like aldo/keto reductase